MDVTASAALLERAEVLAELETLLAGASVGRGGAFLVEGDAGLGKTAVLERAREEAGRRSMAVRAAGGGELEQDLPWGVARDLLAQDARRAGATGPAAAVLGTALSAPGDDVAALHALTEVCLDLAEAGPLLLAVDDAHWADRPSARWLAYLAPRLREAPVALVVAARPRDPRRPAELTTLAGRAGVRRVGLAPLTDEGVSELVRQSLPDSDTELHRACASATGGNPFLLSELMAELRRTPAIDAAEVPSLAIDRVDRAVACRLVEVGPEARGLAVAVAVLGAAADTPLAARLAGLSDQAARAAADALRGAGLLAGESGRRLAFVHPLVRSAVEREVPSAQRSGAHLAAARIVDLETGAVERVGAHLLHVEPGSDQWVRARLTAAADAASGAGSPRAALALLERALAERCGPPTPGLRERLGRAALGIEPALAALHLRAAYEQAADPAGRVERALELSVALQGSSRWTEAVVLLEELGEELLREGADRGLWLRVQGELLAQSFFDERHRARWRAWLERAVDDLDVASDGDAALTVLLQQAVAEVVDGSADRGRELGWAAWADGRLVDANDRESPAIWWVTYVGLYTGDLALAESAISRELRDAARAGSSTALAYASTQLAELELRRGDLRASAEAAETAWAVCDELGPDFWCWWITLAARMQAAIARGHPNEALRMIADTGLVDDDLPPVMALPLLRAQRPAARIAAGDAARGVPELLLAHRWAVERAPSPGGWLTGTHVVDGLLALGRRKEADAFASEWLAGTVAFGADLTIGLAQRALGLCRDGGEQLELLEQAELTLSRTAARHEHARALLELGACLRRANRKADARPPLRRALDLSVRSGADATAGRAREELAATGSRPRNVLLEGVEALTASERRVARMAAAGASNPEIAAALFVTRKTVEKHLGNAYLKLGISSRAELPAALAAG